LRPGSVIVTAEKSTVDVLMGDKDAVGITPNMAASAASAPLGDPDIVEKTIRCTSRKRNRANLVRIFQSSVMAVDKLTVDRTGVDEVSETQLDLAARDKSWAWSRSCPPPPSTRSRFRMGSRESGERFYVLSSSGATYVMKKKPNEAGVLAGACAGGSGQPGHDPDRPPAGVVMIPRPGVVSSTSDSLDSRLVGPV